MTTCCFYFLSCFFPSLSFSTRLSNFTYSANYPSSSGYRNKHRQCLFCLTRQKHCWSYFSFSRTQLDKVITWWVWNARPAQLRSVMSEFDGQILA